MTSTFDHNTAEHLRELEKWREDDAKEEALDQAIQRVEALRDKRWMDKVLQTGAYDLGALDLNTLRTFAMQARIYETRFRERANLFTAEINRRQRAQVTPEYDPPAYLRASK